MAKPPRFPFAALVGLDTLKLALQLAAIDFRLSVLVRGDKGAGKTTAARGLADLLAPGAPFITLPIGATEDRLLGGLDLTGAMKGEPALKPGLLADAHGGVLYIDEVNLLPDHLADALLDAVASGVHVVEREGFSATQTTEFVMIGSMNPEEGALRPQLLDRFALAVDVETPIDPDARSEVLDRRVAYDADPIGFAEEWTAESTRGRDSLAAARARVPTIDLPRAMLRHIAMRVAEHGVGSLRADLAVVRASRACAALDGATRVTPDHVERVLWLALAHRSSVGSPPPPAAPPERRGPRGDSSSSDADEGDDEGHAVAERIFTSKPMAAPRVVVEHATAGGGGHAAALASTAAHGPVIGTRRTSEPREFDARSSLLHAVARSGSPAPLLAEDLHEKTRAPRAGTRYIVILDSSGSHAVHERMSLVKGTIAGLLDATCGRRDEIVMIVCRGAAASVLLEPTTSRADVARALDYVPTGGRTPLAHALELAATYITDRAVALLVTDGHANVPRRSEDAWADTLAAAGALRCPALVIDSEDDRHVTGRAHALAEAMHATYARIADVDQATVLRLVREVS